MTISNDMIADCKIDTRTQAEAFTANLSNFRRTANWLTAAGKTPSQADFSVQLGVHFEEIGEFLRTISLHSPTGISHAAMEEVAGALEGLGKNLKARHVVAVIYDHEAALDALSDGEVTANGVAFLLGYDKEGHDAQVLFKNEDKFVEGVPVILPGGKIGKRDGWTQPDAAPFVTNVISFEAA